MHVFIDVRPEDHDNFIAALEKAFSTDNADAIKQADMIRRQKKAEYDKKRYEEKRNSTVKKVEDFQEEKDEEKEERKESNKEKKEEREVEREEKIINSAAPKKLKFGSCENVLLTEEEYEKLKAKYPDVDEKVEAMSLYFASKGNAGKYKSHYATFLNWERMANERNAVRQRTAPKQNKTAYEMLEEMGLA